jgi:hypothetical protein
MSQQLVLVIWYASDWWRHADILAVCPGSDMAQRRFTVPPPNVSEFWSLISKNCLPTIPTCMSSVQKRTDLGSPGWVCVISVRQVGPDAELFQQPDNEAWKLGFRQKKANFDFPAEEMKVETTLAGIAGFLQHLQFWISYADHTQMSRFSTHWHAVAEWLSLSDQSIRGWLVGGRRRSSYGLAGWFRSNALFGYLSWTKSMHATMHLRPPWCRLCIRRNRASLSIQDNLIHAGCRGPCVRRPELWSIHATKHDPVSYQTNTKATKHDYLYELNLAPLVLHSPTILDEAAMASTL